MNTTSHRDPYLWLLAWFTLSLIWGLGIAVLLQPLKAVQIDYWYFGIYVISGLAVIGVALSTLYFFQPHFFEGLKEFTPVGAIFLAVFALFGFLISAEQEGDGHFLKNS